MKLMLAENFPESKNLAAVANHHFQGVERLSEIKRSQNRAQQLIKSQFSQFQIVPTPFIIIDQNFNRNVGSADSLHI